MGRTGVGDTRFGVRRPAAAAESRIRWRERRSAFSADEEAVIDAFVDASLLVSAADPADPDAEPVVEVAHEALLR